MCPHAMKDGIDWNRIETVVFDLDGTLYDQSALRLRMAWMLLAHCLTRRERWGSLKIIQAVRSYREEMAEEGVADILVRQYEIPAARLGIAPDIVSRVAHEWIDLRPLPLLAGNVRPGTRELFSALSGSGRRICVYSDHPVDEKLAALDLTADLTVYSGSPHIDRLKPNPRGLQWIMEQTGVEPRACLMIGDRLDRDGEAARRAGVPFLLLGQRRHKAVPVCRNFADPIFDPILSAREVMKEEGHVLYKDRTAGT